MQEDHAELLPEHAIHDEINGRVDLHHQRAHGVETQVVGVDPQVDRLDRGQQDVVDNRRELAHEEHDDDGDQHDGEVVFTLGRRRDLLAHEARPVEGADEGGVEDEEDAERDEEHEEELQVDEVDLLEDVVVAELGRVGHGLRLVGPGHQVHLDAVVEVARDVVHHHPQEDQHHGLLGARLGAHVGRVQRLAHGDVPLHGEGHAGVDGAHLSGQPDGVAKRDRVVVAEVVVLQQRRLGVQVGQAEEDDHGDEDDVVVDGERDEVEGGGRLHAAVAQHDDGERVRYQAERRQRVAKDTQHVEVERADVGALGCQAEVGVRVALKALIEQHRHHVGGEFIHFCDFLGLSPRHSLEKEKWDIKFYTWISYINSNI